MSDFLMSDFFDAMALIIISGTLPFNFSTSQPFNCFSFLKAHHLFKLNCLPAAYFNFFAALHFKEQATIKVRFYFVN